MYKLLAASFLLLAVPAYAAEEVATPAPTATTSKIVSRDSFEISYNDAEEAVSRALTIKGVGDKVTSKINGHKFGAIFAYDKPLTVDTRGLQFDKQSGRWNASLLFVTEDGTVVTALPASGHFEEMIEVPVLKREVRNTDVIRDTDIEVRDFAMDHTRSDTVTDISSLIGKTPLHSISPYRPIRETELVNPTMVKKDAMVQIRYNAPGMEITTAGQAMSKGAKGDVISVRNVTSKKIVQAVIENADTVSIITHSTETLNPVSRVSGCTGSCANDKPDPAQSLRASQDVMTGGDHATN